ncbi:MAG: HDIG domain-containing protein [Clostridia bacterium]|nr:HDIG domain-containing protein [Clostridia bacterium]
MSRRPATTVWVRLRLERLRHSGARRAALAFAFLLASAGVLSSAFVPERVDVQLNQPARGAIKAPREFVDWPTTRRMQDEAAAKVTDIYTLDPKVTQDAMAQLDAVFAAIDALRASQDADDRRIAALRRASGFPVDDRVALAVLQLPEADWTSLKRQARDLLLAEMNQGIRQESLETFRRDATATVMTWNYDRPILSFATEVVQAALRPNVLFDAEKTQAARAQARAAVEPIVVLKGQTIVPDGAVITAEDLERLRDAGLLRSGRDYAVMASALLIAAVLEALLGLYLRYFRPRIWSDDRRVVLLALVLAVVLVVERVLLQVSPYLAPVACAAMLIAILIGPEVALVGVLYEALSLGFMSGHDLRYAFAALTGGFAAAVSVRRVDQRGEVMRGGFLAAGANLVAILATALLSGEVADATGVWMDAAFGAINGMLSGILTIGSLPYLEQAFGILTSVRLLELSNPNHPLLRRMLREAPGTYHHSLMVANLCEAAAEAIDANPLLARVGAYYHDIGKLKRPYFFVDNQFGGENPHDRLSPSLSALIVISHVKDGLELAREYKLPEEIARFIPEHHGTMLVSYFHRKAVEASDGPVDEAQFRYPGPLPQSKEAAIMMLADGAEASVRALKDPTPDRIEAQVRKIIRERLEAGQLDQADVTLKDLDTIARTFTHVLMGLHHQRIPYPEQIAEELRRSGEKHERRRERKGFLRTGTERR